MGKAGLHLQDPDNEGNWLAVKAEPNGSLPVTLQDQITPIVSMLAIRETGNITLDANVGDITAGLVYTCDLVAGHNVSVGDVIEFYEGTRFFQAFVLIVATDTITLDRPFEFSFTTSATGKKGDHDLSVDGSVTPQIFRVTSKYLQAGEAWDISSFNLDITDQTAMDDATFGGILALARGLLGRLKNSIYHNLYLAKTNGDLRLGFNNVIYSDKAPAGFFGITAKTKIGGQGQLGVVIRLLADDSDEIQFIVQDDLRNLDHVHMLVSGSVTIL